MVTCPQCNHSNDDSAAFCDQCGTPLARMASAGGASGFQPAVQPVGGGTGYGGGGNVCPSCGAQVIPGEAFCESCGAVLSQPVVVAPPNPAGYVSPQPPVVPPPVIAPALPAMLVAANGQTYQLTGKTNYLVGRQDDVSGIHPEVDTTGSGGFEGGVGRKHAEIVQQGNQWLLKDLNSVNGTWVNNQKLAANSPQPLRPGDQIRLGRWTATFQQ